MPTATRSKRSEVPTLPVNDRTMTSLAQVFKLLADESRLRILLTLAREGETHVSALCEMLGQSQPAVSHHLTLLRMAGLVGFRREGKFNFYRMDGLQLGELLELSDIVSLHVPLTDLTRHMVGAAQYGQKRRRLIE